MPSRRALIRVQLDERFGGELAVFDGAYRANPQVLENQPGVGSTTAAIYMVVGTRKRVEVRSACRPSASASSGLRHPDGRISRKNALAYRCSQTVLPAASGHRPEAINRERYRHESLIAASMSAGRAFVLFIRWRCVNSPVTGASRELQGKACRNACGRRRCAVERRLRAVSISTSGARINASTGDSAPAENRAISPKQSPAVSALSKRPVSTPRTSPAQMKREEVAVWFAFLHERRCGAGRRTIRRYQNDFPQLTSENSRKKAIPGGSGISAARQWVPRWSAVDSDPVRDHARNRSTTGIACPRSSPSPASRLHRGLAELQD